MMGHKEELKGGDEHDYFCRACRRFHGHPKDAKEIKRRFWKRIRSKIRQAMGLQKP